MEYRQSSLGTERVGAGGGTDRAGPRHRQGFWVCAAGTCFETVSKARTGMPP